MGSLARWSFVDRLLTDSTAPEAACAVALPTHDTVHSYSIDGNMELLRQLGVLAYAAKYDGWRGSRGVASLDAGQRYIASGRQARNQEESVVTSMRTNPSVDASAIVS